VLQAVPEMMSKALGTSDGDDDADPEALETARLAQTLPPDETQLLYSLCLHGRGELGLAPDEYAALTMVLLRLLAFKPSGFVAASAASKAGSAAEPAKKPLSPPEPFRAPQPGGLPAAVKTPEIPPKTPENSDFEVSNQPPDQSARAQAAPESVAPKSVPAEPADPVSTELGDFWASLVTQLVASDAVKTMARELALQSQLVAQDSAVWTLRVESPSLNSPANIDKLQGAIHAAKQGAPAVQLVVEIGPVADTPVRRNQALAKDRQAQAEALIHSDPFVQEMVRNWGGKVVPGSIKYTVHAVAADTAKPI
jgi:DNA polymerase-3 subunit gamma/tau